MGELSEVLQASRASIIGQRGKWSTAFCLDPRVLVTYQVQLLRLQLSGRFIRAEFKAEKFSPAAARFSGVGLKSGCG